MITHYGSVTLSFDYVAMKWKWKIAGFHFEKSGSVDKAGVEVKQLIRSICEKVCQEQVSP